MLKFVIRISFFPHVLVGLFIIYKHKPLDEGINKRIQKKFNVFFIDFNKVFKNKKTPEFSERL